MRKKIFTLLIPALIALVLAANAYRPAAAMDKNAIFSIVSNGAQAAPGTTTEIVVRASIKKPYHLYAPGDTTGGVPLSYSISSPAVESYFVSYPEPQTKRYPALGEKLLLYEGEVDSTLCVRLAPGASTTDAKLEITVAYQACTDAMCTPPARETLEANLKIGGTPAAEGAQPRAAAPEKPLRASGSKAADGPTFSGFYEKSFFLAVVMAFFWGLVSSLTPCVYPMIPITVAFFGGQAVDGRGRKTLALAMTFTIGIALSFAALGVFVTFVGADMGSVMSNAWIVALLTLLLLFFAGAMLELYELRLPDSMMARVGQSERGYAGAFTMGLTMGLVAAPCVGPFAGSLLLFVSTIKSPAVGFVMLFSYGLGLGMLFLAVAMGANFLPRSGMWMVRLKNFFGLLILWITLYFMQFVTPAWLLLTVSSFYAVVTAAALGVFSSLDENSPLINHFAKGAGVVALALASFFAAMAVIESGAAGPTVLNALSRSGRETSGFVNTDAWIKSYEAGMKAARAEKKPVIIDFYADWCLPCKQMEASVFKNAEFISASERFIKIKLDCTDPAGEGATIKNKKYGSPYMPFIIFYDGAGNKVDAEIRGYASLNQMLEILQNIK